MGNALSHDEDEDEGDAWSRAMDADNFKTWKEKESDFKRERLAVRFEQQSPSQDNIQGVSAAIVPGERLIRVTYTSQLSAQGTTSEQQHHMLTMICKQAMQSNPLLQIGGVLCFDEMSQCILQELEGPESATRWLLGKIRNDQRHHSLLVVREDEVPSAAQRKHAGMGMTFGSNGEASPQRALYSEPCVRLMYTSVLCAKGRAASALVATVVRSAGKNNPRLHIGGELLVNLETSQVIQVLEGSVSLVTALYQTIKRDLRHKHCTLLCEETVPQGTRRYHHWGMAQGNFADLHARLGPEVCAMAKQHLIRWEEERHAAEAAGQAATESECSFTSASTRVRVGFAEASAPPPVYALPPPAAKPMAEADKKVASSLRAARRRRSKEEEVKEGAAFIKGLTPILHGSMASLTSTRATGSPGGLFSSGGGGRRVQTAAQGLSC